MIIPEIDQQLATVKTIAIQYDDDFHISYEDYQQFKNAVTHIEYLYNKVTERKRKAGDQV